jgi:hypothetical protein
MELSPSSDVNTLSRRDDSQRVKDCEGLLPPSPDSATGPWPEPAASSPQPHTGTIFI